MKYPYASTYQPPFPALQITLAHVEIGRRTTPMSALLDTGADGSLIPITLLRQILTPPIAETRLRSHWGEWRSAQLFELDIELEQFRLPGVIVVGDELGDEIILGRNVLNKLRLHLDGPANVSEIA